ncbi:MAG: type II toxin-antitoxin system RelE family toxin [Thermodesulfovibrionales bacterium]
MKWRIDYSRDAEKFIEKQKIRLEVREELKKFLMKMKGENVNIDIKKLSGEWEGYYRLRKGKLRIIFEPNKTDKVLFVERIDFRGDVYK